MSDGISPFADFLDQRREDITAEWLRRVRRDRKIPSAADLPKEELLDHLPYLLDTLIKQLRGTLVDGVGSSPMAKFAGNSTIVWTKCYGRFPSCERY